MFGTMFWAISIIHFLSYASLIQGRRALSSSQIVDPQDFPEFDMGDKVEFYFIEGVFPYTTPAWIKLNMGEIWNQYSLTHAGLGIWNKDSNVKYSLEIVCLNYTGMSDEIHLKHVGVGFVTCCIT